MASSAVELPGQQGRQELPDHAATMGAVPNLEKYVKVRIGAKRRQRWKFEATLRGQTLSELVRTAVEAELAAPAATARAGVSVAPHRQLAPARAVAPTIEERLAAIGELVEKL